MVLAALRAAVQELQQVFLCDRILDAATDGCRDRDRLHVTKHVMTSPFPVAVVKLVHIFSGLGIPF